MNKYDKALLSGTVLRGKKNSYRIDRVLGQGTFGITYLAYTTVTVEGDLGKLQGEMQVAVKEFFMSDINGREGSSVTTGGSGELFDRYRHKFAREASNLAKLKHRGIVKVIETFEANGTSYYAMEYCGGGSLDALIAKRGGLPEGEALRYFGQIAEALSYMHSQRMLHLDLKPGNVMLRTSGEAVLIDFGLSKQFNDKGEPESSTTIGGGTPGYAPLEQANYREDSGKLPVTMDVYALGGMLYKMLTGKRPPVASDVLIEFPEQPLRDHKVSNNVITAIRRAMESKPHDRYQSVAAFAAALDCASEGTEPADREEEPEVVLVDDGRQSVAESQPHTPAAEPAHAHQEQQQNEYPEPEQPRRKCQPWNEWLAWAVTVDLILLSVLPIYAFYVNGIFFYEDIFYRIDCNILTILGVAVVIVLFILRCRWRSRIKLKQVPASNKTLRKWWAVAVSVCFISLANYLLWIYPAILFYHLWFLGDVAMLLLMILRWRSYVKSKRALNLNKHSASI